MLNTLIYEVNVAIESLASVKKDLMHKLVLTNQYITFC
jgi:hypothetical protein